MTNTTAYFMLVQNTVRNFFIAVTADETAKLRFNFNTEKNYEFVRLLNKILPSKKTIFFSNVNVIKLFSSSLTLGQNKLECLTRFYYRVGLNPIH